MDMGQDPRTNFMDNSTIFSTDLAMSDLGVVDGPVFAPQDFDELSALTQDALNVDVALVSIVENELDRQFFAGQVGLGAPWCDSRQTPLSHSFCQYVKASAAPLIVQDAREDDLLKTNRAVDVLGVIAYLGVPIHDPAGAPIGALCAICSRPRKWTDHEQSILTKIAKCVDKEIVLRAQCLENSHLAAIAEQGRLREQRYATMLEAVTAAFMAPKLSLEDRVAECLRGTCRAIGYDLGNIVQITGGGARAVFCYPDTDATQLSVSDDTEVFQRIESCQGIIERRNSDGILHNCLGAPVAALVAVPLMVKDILFGFMELSTTDGRRILTHEETAILLLVSMSLCVYLDLVGEVSMLRRVEPLGSSY